MQSWSSNGTKFVFMANVGFSEQPDTNISDIARDFLHQKPNKWLWLFLQASETTRQQFKQEDIADVVFAPPAAVLSQELADMWGERTELSQPAEQDVSPVLPHVHSTPAKFGVVSVLSTTSQDMSPIGEEHPPDLTNWLKASSTSRVSPSLISKLLVVRTFRERTLHRRESDTLESFMVNKASKKKCASRAFFLRWYGLEDTPVGMILDEHMPCHGMIVRTTGARASPTSRYASECGVDRYCKNCEKVLEMLSQGYGLNTIADVLLALITKAVPTWSNGSSGGVEWARREGVDRVHCCEANCHGRS